MRLAKASAVVSFLLCVSRRIPVARFLLAIMLGASVSASAFAQTTTIQRSDGSTTTIDTKSRDTQVIHSTGGGRTEGSSMSHKDIVKQERRPDDRAVKTKK